MIRRLMLPKKLPKHLQVIRLCRTAPKEGLHLAGEMAMSDLNNISLDLKSQTTPVAVSLIFSVDEEGLCCIAGEITGKIALICQRCMEPMDYDLCASISVSPVVSIEEAKRLPERYEPLLAAEGEVILAEWIAEELHLALPLVPRHDGPCPKDAEH